MSQSTSQFEKVDGGKVKLTITVTAERFREGLQHSYNRNKHHFNVPGFRKGKVPRKLIEQSYGKDVFYDDAVNFVLPDAYEAALDEHNVNPVYRPEIKLGDISEQDGAIFFAEVAVRPEAKITDLKDLTYSKGTEGATDEEIDAAIKRQQEMNARQVTVDRAAAMDDIVTINFKGFVGDEPFEGGQGEDFNLTLGSGQFIPGFEEQLVGKKAGDDVTVEVAFPEEYHHEPLAGKPARFEVEILDVQAKELPELTDDFAQDVSEFDTLAEYRADLAKNIAENKEKNTINVQRGQVLKQLAEKTTVDIPEEMYLGRVDEMMDDFKNQLRMQGMDIENYMRYTGLTEEAMQASMRKQAEVDVKNMLALEAVAKKQKLAVSDEEFEAKIAEVLKMEGDALANFITNMPAERKKEFTLGMLRDKALDFAISKAKAIDEPLPTEENEAEEE
ncbi:MAG: trigger factor [Defluviitaleaceae bacterium]|nr:trigger factor [Defluviitaleaceae bacterium]